MRRRGTSPTVFLVAWALFVGCDLPWVKADDDLEKHLAALQSQVANHSLGLEKRGQLVLEMAATLDRAAQSASTAQERRKRWTEAITLIDRFDSENQGHSQANQFRFQSAVYLWARGRLWADQQELTPGDREARNSAIENLDVAISRFRALNGALRAEDKVLAQNVRFRLAQALADRARLDPDDSEEQRSRLREAEQVLGKPIDEPALVGFASLLRAEVLAKLGDEKGATTALESAEKATPPPPPEAILEAKIGIATAGKRFDQAVKAIESSTIGATGKALLTLRVRLNQRARLAPGSARSEVEKALFQAVRPLQGSSNTEARLALLDLARGIKEPDDTQDPSAWDILAEAAIAAGDLARASALNTKGAERADAVGQPEKAAALRLRAGASLFQAGKFLEADAILTRVADDRQGGASRAKAGLLRIMARARALATKLPEASQSAYTAALEAQIRDFPTDSSANEARWLLGKYRLATSKSAEAQALWAEIPHSDPHWLDARLAIAELRQEALDTQRMNNDRTLVRQRYTEARSFLNESYTQCQNDSQRAAINLALVRLELTPEVGQAEEARRLCESIQRSASQAEQRDRARRFHLVAIAALNHFLEAEQAARSELKLSHPADLLETARLLDLVASESSSDLKVRRFGLINRLLLAGILEHPEELSRAQLGEAKLRQTRAWLFIGDEARSRASITAEWGTPPSLDDRILRDMADTYIRLSAFDLAAEVQRLRSRQAVTGSPAWFESRYGVALAQYRAGKNREAAKLIDATAILHPELGGGDLRDKFVHLRERLNPEQ
ncbi:coiled-coil domain-containing protein [Singulisphaera acidiphila]|uniref:Tetratricopeptide repeat protein n=1 Tax=Singulisphaera acidiphila (strain ATCC BAA-1392 / DSM 18658 / VKM B-2454 / MOB10) TaxID=886293 RepID=L0DD62_SINAD|nr:hypothetical protein [Singulisphaera acidiphila]AGA27304.1 hypothetical protein Sinac_3021 [Singulisphaera acidiphila DSM 18658]